MDSTEHDLSHSDAADGREAILEASVTKENEPKPVPEAQRFTDDLVRRALLWMFPYWLRPNHFTVLRFVLTPVVLVLLYYQHHWWAFGVFVAAICTDFIDGAMARTRNQISSLGMILDPIADKLLVGSVLAWIGWRHLVVQIILGFIALELLLMAVGLGIAKPGDRARPANAFGKAKMVVQSIALILFLIAGILNIGPVRSVSLYMLWVAIGLAVLSGLRHVIETLTRRDRLRV